MMASILSSTFSVSLLSVGETAATVARPPDPVVIHGAILAVAGIAMLYFLICPLQTQNLLFVRRCLQAASFMRCLSHFAFTSVMLAIAYDVTPDDEHRAAVSGA